MSGRRWGQKKYSFVSGATGDENESHAGGRKNIFFWNKCEEKYRRKFVILFFWVAIGLIDIELALYRRISLYVHSKRRFSANFWTGLKSWGCRNDCPEDLFYKQLRFRVKPQEPFRKSSGAQRRKNEVAYEKPVYTTWSVVQLLLRDTVYTSVVPYNPPLQWRTTPITNNQHH